MKFLYIFFLILIISACRFLGDRHTVNISMPVQRDNLFTVEPGYWELSYRDENGILQSVSVDCEENDSLVFDFIKGKTTALTIEAVFVLEDGRTFRSQPAGFLYPFDTESRGVGSFSWDEGFVGSVILKCSEYINPDYINIPRLRSLIDEKAGSDSRWVLDYQVLCNEIIAGDLSYYDVRKMRFREVNLRLPQGLWTNRDVFGVDIVSEGVSVYTDASFPTGVNKLMNSSGLILELHIKSDGKYEYMVY